MTGCSTPLALIEAASSRIASSSKLIRGWCGLGAMSATGSSCAPLVVGSAVAVAEPGEISASRPRPSTFLCTLDDLLRELPIAVGPAAVRVVQHDRLAERRRLAEAHVSWDHIMVQPISEKL